MKKIFVMIVALVLVVAMSTSCTSDRQTYRPGRIVDINGDLITVDVAGKRYDYYGEVYPKGERVMVELSNEQHVTNAVPLNEWPY